MLDLNEQPFIDLNFRLASHQKQRREVQAGVTRTHSAEWCTVDRRRVHGSDNRQFKIAPFKTRQSNNSTQPLQSLSTE